MTSNKQNLDESLIIKCYNVLFQELCKPAYVTLISFGSTQVYECESDC